MKILNETKKNNLFVLFHPDGTVKDVQYVTNTLKWQDRQTEARKKEALWEIGCYENVLLKKGYTRSNAFLFEGTVFLEKENWSNYVFNIEGMDSSVFMSKDGVFRLLQAVSLKSISIEGEMKFKGIFEIRATSKGIFINPAKI